MRVSELVIDENGHGGVLVQETFLDHFTVFFRDLKAYS